MLLDIPDNSINCNQCNEEEKKNELFIFIPYLMYPKPQRWVKSQQGLTS